MSYAVVRVQKMTAGSVRGIQIHDRREKSESHTNPDIDRNRTQQNYDLCPDSNPDFYRAVKERIEQLDLKKAVRKDAVVMAQVLVTSDGLFFDDLKPQIIPNCEYSDMPWLQKTEWTEDKAKPFFEAAYNFLAERYGRENVISATVHMDERTPHMHFNFVPVTADGRLSAKSILTRESLTEQQTAFHEQVGKHFGLQRGEARESGKRRTHMETAEYKDYVAVEQEAAQRAAEATRKAQEAERALLPLQERQNALEGQINALTWQLDKAREELAATNTKRAQIEKALADFNERIKNGTPTERKAFNFIDGKLSEIRNERAKQYIERKD